MNSIVDFKDHFPQGNNDRPVSVMQSAIDLLYRQETKARAKHLRPRDIRVVCFPFLTRARVFFPLFWF